MRAILLCGCETWPVRVADERMLEVFHNDSIHCILRVRRGDCNKNNQDSEDVECVIYLFEEKCDHIKIRTAEKCFAA